MLRTPFVTSVVLFLSAGALAQNAAPPSPDATALRGPSVPERASNSLVERDSDGRVRRLDQPPEVAALKLIEVPADVMERIEAMLLKRSKFLDSFVEKNLDLLSKLDTAGQTNDKVDQAMLGMEAISKLAPLTAEGSLRKQIRTLLPMEAAAKFDEVVKDYWDAIVAQERKLDPEKGRWQIVTGERLQSLVREVGAAFERLEKSGTLLFSYFFAKVELSKTQEGEIRAILDEFVDETMGAPTPKQQHDVFIKVMACLDTKQQIALVKEFKQRENPKPEKAPMKAAPTKKSMM